MRTRQRRMEEGTLQEQPEQGYGEREEKKPLPLRDATQVTVTLEEAKALHPYPRSILTLDAVTAAVVQWELYASYNLGRTLRAWVRPVHTGEGGRVVGQGIAALASAGGVVLVWTGLALAWRRFRARHDRPSRRTSEVTPP